MVTMNLENVNKVSSAVNKKSSDVVENILSKDISSLSLGKSLSVPRPKNLHWNNLILSRGKYLRLLTKILFPFYYQEEAAIKKVEGN